MVGVHSFGDDRMAFAETAEHLTGRGHTVIGYDQPGFGATPARGSYASDDTYREHLAHVVRFARAPAPPRPVVVIAESFGASAALSAAARALIAMDGLILSGPGVREDIPAKPFWNGLISTASSVFGSRSVRLPRARSQMSDMARMTP
ncbi:MAG: alpha/beta fold hydrolase [Hyphomicrobiales bacterium]|nr:alpha/beta fold hydrolase [Hyphomicrobiales bacterium]